MLASTIDCRPLWVGIALIYAALRSLTVLGAEPMGWPAYGATPGGTHFSAAQQITPDNVAELEIAWMHRSGDVRQGSLDQQDRVVQSSLQVTPIVVDDHMYYCTPFNRVFALDAGSGEELWSFDPDVDHAAYILGNCRGVSSWQSGKTGFCEHRILLGTLDARLIALDANTGKRCTDFGDSGEVDITHRISKHDPVEYGITSPPAILGDRVITGAMVLDNIRTDAPSGVVRAYDVRSGELLWAWNPVKPGDRQTEADGSYRSGSTNVWSIIAVDPERDMVFVPTGNTSPDFYGGHRDGLDYYSSSVVALHGASGELAWHYQLVHHDIWDYDTPAQPTLVDLQVNGELVPAVVQVTKMGMTFALHRDSGEPLWPVEERPAPQGDKVPGEYLAATQPYPGHIPPLIEQPLTADDAWGLSFWDKGACADSIRELNNQGLYTPPSAHGSVHYPMSFGGNNWGSPAIHPQSRVMVVFTNRVPGEITLTPREQCSGWLQGQQGTPYCVETAMIASPLGMPCTEPPWGTLDAIDLEAGKLLWSVPLGSTRDIAPFPLWWIKGVPGIAAPMMTAGGLVFSGMSNEHAFRAFDLATGEELWKTRLPTAANALPMSYQASGGRQFVVIAAGGHWSGGSPPGDYIIAFALPEAGGD
ncbi:MAG: pyrroloquinoline quinone-dependent dehydrogenase [Halieaceae bacterium]